METNKKIMKVYLTKKEKEGLSNIVVVTDVEALRKELISNVCTIYYTGDNKEDIRALIIDNMEALESVHILPIMTKANNIEFTEMYNSTFARASLDVDAYQLLKGKTSNYYLQNVQELIANITDFAIKRGYYITGVAELDEPKKALPLDVTLVAGNEGTKKSLEELGFFVVLLDTKEFCNLKAKKVVLINSNRENIDKLLAYCFSIKIINISIMDKQEIVKKILDAKEILPSWVSITDKGKYRLNQDLLAIQYIKNTNLLQVLNADKQDNYIYDNGVYKLVSKDYVKKELSSYLPQGIGNNSFIGDAYAMVVNRAKLVKFEDFDADENIINFKNGIYNISKDILEPHDPSILSTLQLNCNYLPMEKATNFKKWGKYINDLCTDINTKEVDYKKMEQLQIWGGLTLSNIPMYKAKACLCLYSRNGDTGKSIFLNTLIALLGQENTSNIQIQDLAKPFATSAIYGKRANIVGDQKATTLQDSSIFKQFTGGDLINIEFKGKTSFSCRHNGGLLFACNRLPHIADDKGTHIYDRLHIIPFNNVIPLAERNANLLNELKEELDFIAQFFIVGLKKFIKNGYKIYRCKASKDAIEDYRKNNDNFYDYLMTLYEITNDTKDRVLKTFLENEYIKWCEEEELKESARLPKRAIQSILLDSYNIPLGKVKGGWYYKKIKEKTIKEIEQGEEVEKEAKQIFTQQKL